MIIQFSERSSVSSQLKLALKNSLGESRRLKSSLRLSHLLKLALPPWMLTVCSTSLAQTPTTFSLTLSSGGNQVGAVSAGSMVTLTASVTAGSTAVQRGQVKFCDATAAHCTDIHLLGTAQLTSAGNAVLSLRPGVGIY